MSTVIEIRDLRKSYGDFVAVNGISLEVNKGEVFGLLGPNGAGKTTAMKMMYCSVVPDQGEIFVLGLNQRKNYRQIKSRIGVVPQEDSLDQEFTVRENLLVQASYFLIDPVVAQRKADELLRIVRLEREAHRPIPASRARETSSGRDSRARPTTLWAACVDRTRAWGTSLHRVNRSFR